MGDALDAFFEELFIIGDFDIHDRLHHGLSDDGKKAEGYNIEDKLDRIGFGNQAFAVPSGDDSLEHAGRCGGIRGDSFSDKRRDIPGGKDHLTDDHFSDLIFSLKNNGCKGLEGFRTSGLVYNSPRLFSKIRIPFWGLLQIPHNFPRYPPTYLLK